MLLTKFYIFSGDTDHEASQLLANSTPFDPMVRITNHVDGATVNCGVVALSPHDGAAVVLWLN